MRKFNFFLLVVLFSIPYIVKAQIISYTIPDIATPGMNTYIEIIGHNQLFGNFGTDGFYINNGLPGESVWIELVNPLDSNKVVFSPLVVSWGGRMISTQVLVNPFMQQPNSTHWNLLNQEFRIPFRVVVNGNRSNIDTLFIVRPFNLTSGVITNNPVFGEGELGIRSKRGAMIFDTLYLNRLNYKVSVQDCDPTTPGNQGYLPFVLLVKNNIISNTGGLGAPTIDVSATNRDGGPGGGGGGGRFCDGSLLNPIIGNKGGDGFVKGGSGGRNGSGVANAWVDGGEGTGENGASLNGVAQPAKGWYESSGGATGHPFGTSGRGSYVLDPPTIDNNAGGYGGGSGVNQNMRGGSGANAGNITGTNEFNGGKLHGNYHIVPLHGGSGGASGNLNASHQCSGDGGGGGGGISVFAKHLDSLRIISLGALGENGHSNSHGGDGSAGSIIFSTKTRFNYLFLNANGPTVANFGGGRLRFDCYLFGNQPDRPTPSSAQSSLYTVAITDSSQYVLRQHRLTGSKIPLIPIDIYIRPENGQWTLLERNTAASFPWGVDLELEEPHKVYYIVVLEPNAFTPSPPRIDSCLYIPSFIFSQAGANILIVDSIPTIAGDSLCKMNAIECPGAEVTKKVKIYNIGRAELELYLQESGSAAYLIDGTQGFDWSPKTTITIPGTDSTEIEIRYQYQAGQTGIIRDTLVFYHNDTRSEKLPWRIALEVNLTSIGLEIWDEEKTEQITILDLGTVCVHSPASIDFSIKNVSDTTVTVVIEDIISIHSINAEITVSHSVLAGEFTDARVTVTPLFTDDIEFMLYVRTLECDERYDSVLVRLKVIDADIQFDDDTYYLGEVCPNGILSGDIPFTNLTEMILTIDDLDYTNQGMFNLEVLPSNIINAGQTNLFRVTFRSADPGMHYCEISIGLKECPNYSKTITVVAVVVETELEFLDNGNFPETRIGETSSKAIRMRNNGKGRAYIANLPTVNPPFRVASSNPITPVLLEIDDIIEFVVEFTPQVSGIHSEEMLAISVAQSDDICAANASLPLRGEGTKPSISLSTYNIDFGTIATCQSKRDTVLITNEGNANVRILRANLTGADADAFVKIQEPSGGAAYTLLPNQTQEYIIEFNPAGLPDGEKIAFLNIVSENQTEYPIAPVRLRGKNEFPNITIYPISASFGSVAIGETGELIVTVTNEGELPIRIASVETDIPEIIISPNSAVLLGSESQDFIFSIVFTEAGYFESPIRFIIDEPCEHTFSSQLSGFGLEGEIEYTPSINCGMLAPCETKLDSIRLYNSGETNISVNSFQILGVDAHLFRFTEPIPSFILLPGETRYIQVLFDPQGADDGNKQAYINIEVGMNAIRQILRVNLFGEKRSGLLAVPSQLNFGTVAIGNEKELQITFRNIGFQPIQFVELLPLNVTDIFEVIPNNLSMILNPGEQVTIRVRFTPLDSREYEDNMVFKLRIGECDEELRVRIIGEGSPARTIKIWIPEYREMSPAMNNFKFPLLAELEDGVSEISPIGLEFTADISFDGTLFYPTEVSPASVVWSTSIDESMNRTMTIYRSNVAISEGENVLAEITGYTLIGRVEETMLSINNFDWAENNYIGKSELFNGLLSIKLCKEGGDRLINYSEPLNLMIMPNPASETVNVKISALEVGVHSLEVVTLLGETYKIKTWDVHHSGERDFEFAITLSELSEGMYYLLLKSPSDAKALPLLIIK